MMRLLLDTNLLRRLCHPHRHADVRAWFQGWLSHAGDSGDVEIAVSSVADYELRRGYLWKLDRHEDEPKALRRLDELCELLDCQNVSIDVLRLAAQLWAKARRAGVSTDAESRVDWDVVIAAQATIEPAIVVTSNTSHFTRYGVVARDWDELDVPDGAGNA
jgi:predicted nucleic acid-binding protein